MADLPLNWVINFSGNISATSAPLEEGEVGGKAGLLDVIKLLTHTCRLAKSPSPPVRIYASAWVHLSALLFTLTNAANGSSDSNNNNMSNVATAAAAT